MAGSCHPQNELPHIFIYDALAGWWEQALKIPEIKVHDRPNFVGSLEPPGGVGLDSETVDPIAVLFRIYGQQAAPDVGTASPNQADLIVQQIMRGHFLVESIANPDIQREVAENILHSCYLYAFAVLIPPAIKMSVFAQFFGHSTLGFTDEERMAVENAGLDICPGAEGGLCLEATSRMQTTIESDGEPPAATCIDRGTLFRATGVYGLRKSGKSPGAAELRRAHEMLQPLFDNGEPKQVEAWDRAIASMAKENNPVPLFFGQGGPRSFFAICAYDEAMTLVVNGKETFKAVNARRPEWALLLDISAPSLSTWFMRLAAANYPELGGAANSREYRVAENIARCNNMRVAHLLAGLLGLELDGVWSAADTAARVAKFAWAKNILDNALAADMRILKADTPLAVPLSLSMSGTLRSLPGTRGVVYARNDYDILHGGNCIAPLFLGHKFGFVLAATCDVTGYNTEAPQSERLGAFLSGASIFNMSQFFSGRGNVITMRRDCGRKACGLGIVRPEAAEPPPGAFFSALGESLLQCGPASDPALGAYDRPWGRTNDLSDISEWVRRTLEVSGLTVPGSSVMAFTRTIAQYVGLPCSDVCSGLFPTVLMQWSGERGRNVRVPTTNILSMRLLMSLAGERMRGDRGLEKEIATRFFKCFDDDDGDRKVQLTRAHVESAARDAKIVLRDPSIECVTFRQCLGAASMY